jgi:hypothetical protein
MKYFLYIFLLMQLVGFVNAQIPENKSHDFHYNEWVSEKPPIFLEDFIFMGEVPFISDYLNINVSSNPAPQNEPSLKISPLDPNNIVAAFRDFRTGMNPQSEDGLVIVTQPMAVSRGRLLSFCLH